MQQGWEFINVQNNEQNYILLIKIINIMIQYRIKDKQAFNEWKKLYTTDTGHFKAVGCCEDEPLFYPCVLIEFDIEDENYEVCETHYQFVYLTDFIEDYGHSKL